MRFSKRASEHSSPQAAATNKKTGNRRAAFLDRDGVINVDHGYVHCPEDFEFIEGVFAACKHLQECGYLLVVITNQSGIARGIFSAAQFKRLTEWMVGRFREHGVEITAVYHCPHYPEPGPSRAADCACRKPAPGMLTQAIRELDIDPAASIMIGDRETDMRAAAAAGVGHKILVRSGERISPEAEKSADQVWNSLKDAIKALP